MSLARQIMGGLEGRVRLMLGRAIVRLANDVPRLQELQLDLLADETQDAVERFQDYGFASVPHPQAEAIVACMGGLRSHAVALVVADRRYRLRGMETGEVALFDDLGNVVKLGRDAITITAASRIAIAAPDGVDLDGDLRVTGDVTADGISLKAHVHSGVQAGAATSGGPQ